jgi:hypothetical protein
LWICANNCAYNISTEALDMFSEELSAIRFEAGRGQAIGIEGETRMAGRDFSFLVDHLDALSFAMQLGAHNI